ncbi:uroporphyrinogen-III synthase [Coemansia sp. BCRC 34301]|nr:uroporphyrinogen-III synthase [Coemansia sp. BCRC 34301]
MPFAAIVFTSQNAVQALNRALAKWIAKEGRRERWLGLISLPVFVVGGATGTLCRSTLLSCLPHADVRGERAGGAGAMLPEITEFCQQHRSLNGGVKPRLAFFCGDQRRDTLPDGLRQSGAAELVEVVSYTTVARDADATRRDLIDAITRIKATCWAKHRAVRACAFEGTLATVNRDILIWMVVFSPSGVRVVAPLLAALESEHVLCAGDGSVSSNLPAVHYGLAAIGPTTKEELVAQQVQRHIVLAKEPSVQGICSALRSK